MPRLEVKNLQKGFGGTEVLRGVSFTLESGQVLAIIGEDKLPQVQVLTTLVGEELEIMDPYGAPLPSYGLCFESLSKTSKRLAAWLNEQGEASGNE